MTPSEPERTDVTAINLGQAHLAIHSHRSLSLREIARQCGCTAPALLKYFGSTIGYLAGLAGTQWAQLAKMIESTRSAPEDKALALAMWASDNPNRFGLIYDVELWTRGAVEEGRSSDVQARADRWWQKMEVQRDACFNEFVPTGDRAIRKRERPLLHTHLVTSLATGLAIEFVYGNLYGDQASGDELRALRVLHARAILREALG